MSPKGNFMKGLAGLSRFAHPGFPSFLSKLVFLFYLIGALYEPRENSNDIDYLIYPSTR